MINPYRPTRPVSPELFAGRRAEISRVLTALRQTKAGNPAHFVVLGERGIGKSSFLAYVQDLAEGHGYDDSEQFTFLVVHTDINESVGSVDLARKIELGLRHVLGRTEKGRAFFREVWSFLERIEVMGTSIGKGERATILDDPTVEQFCYSLADTVDRIVHGTGPLTKEFDGVVILIDESDRLGDHLDLGAFAKNLLERLERRRCDRLVLGLAGLPSVLDRLAASHSSAPRLFQHVQLSRLSRPEATEVVDRGLELARKQNRTDIGISDKARSMIVELAAGHPHFLQQIAFSSFAADLDAYIDEEDVHRGLVDPNGALEIIGNIYYHPVFADADLDDIDRAVLRSVASEKERWVRRDEIVDALSAEPQLVLASLDKLAGAEILRRDPRGASRWSYEDRTFGLWVKEFGGSLTPE